jgi:TRAP-type C4-dicarboxylate transport system substrate-binding protein
MIPGRLLAAIALAVFSVGQLLAQNLVLRASHQWPQGDPRDATLRLIASEVAKAGVGLEIAVYPGASLFRPREQWRALTKGLLDMTMLPLEFAAGRHPQFQLALMPGLVRSHERAARLNHSPFMVELRGLAEALGARVIVNGWLAGAFISRDGCVTNPDSIKGKKFRAFGPAFELLFAKAGASISSTPSLEIHTGMQTGDLDGAVVSTLSSNALRLHEVARCATAPGENALWFTYVPIILSQSTYDKLNADQRKALTEAAAKAEVYFAEQSRLADAAMADAFRKAGVEVVALGEQDFATWIALAHESAFRKFGEDVKGGNVFIAKALKFN